MGSVGAEPPVFSLDVTVDDAGATTVAVGGELDLASVDAFSRAVRKGLGSGPVLVDLSRVTFMDSSGVRALNIALQDAGAAGHELKLREEMQPIVVQVLEMTGMLGLLPLESTT